MRWIRPRSKPSFTAWKSSSLTPLKGGGNASLFSYLEDVGVCRGEMQSRGRLPHSLGAGGVRQHAPETSEFAS